MKFFNFSRLINKYSVSFMIVYPENTSKSDNPAHYDDLGKYIGPEVPSGPQLMTGALMPPSERQIYNSGGRLKASDRLLYSTDAQIPEGSKILYKDMTYQVMPRSNFEDFANFAQYECKAVENID